MMLVFLVEFLHEYAPWLYEGFCPCYGLINTGTQLTTGMAILKLFCQAIPLGIGTTAGLYFLIKPICWFLKCLKDEPNNFLRDWLNH